MAPIRKKLGEILVEQSATSQEAVQRALALQPQRGLKLGRLLVEAKAVTEEALARALSAQSRMPLAKMKSDLPASLLAHMPADLAHKVKAVPFGQRVADGVDTLYVAVADPYDTAGMDEIRVRLARPIKFALAALDDLERTLTRVPQPAPAAVVAPAAPTAPAPVPTPSATPAPASVAPPVARVAQPPVAKPLAATPAPVPAPKLGSDPLADLFPTTPAAPPPPPTPSAASSSAEDLDALLGLAPAPPPPSPSSILDDLLGTGPAPVPAPVPLAVATPMPTAASPIAVTHFPSKHAVATPRQLVAEAEDGPMSWADGFMAQGSPASGPAPADAGGIDLPEDNQSLELELNADAAASLGVPFAMSPPPPPVAPPTDPFAAIVSASVPANPDEDDLPVLEALPEDETPTLELGEAEIELTAAEIAAEPAPFPVATEFIPEPPLAAPLPPPPPVEEPSVVLSDGLMTGGSSVVVSPDLLAPGSGLDFFGDETLGPASPPPAPVDFASEQGADNPIARPAAPQWIRGGATAGSGGRRARRGARISWGLRPWRCVGG
ncbi:MAG: hypothetical protein QM765_18225 [Myxococcales bacterium]